MATAKIQTANGFRMEFFSIIAKKPPLGLDGLDSRNGYKMWIAFDREICYTLYKSLLFSSAFLYQGVILCFHLFQIKNMMN